MAMAWDEDYTSNEQSAERDTLIVLMSMLVSAD